MVMLSKDHGAAYRTRCMSRSHADQFAACLEANPAFQNIHVCESTQAHGETRWYVVYHPRNAEVADMLLDRQQDQRAERSRAESSQYLFVRDDSGRHYWCQVASGEVYEVTLFSCSCGDAVYRANPNGLRCKHSIGLQGALEDGTSRVL